MKNLFKVSALVLGLGLGFSQGASAAIIDSSNFEPTKVFNFSEVAGANSSFVVSDAINIGDLVEVDVSLNPITGAKSSTVTGFNDVIKFNLPANTLGAFAEGSTYKVALKGSTVLDYYLTNATTTWSSADLDSGIKLSSGSYDLHVNGSLKGLSPSEYSAYLAVSPVPEVEEWAMMFVGLGLIGVVAGKQKEGGFKIAQG
jgi:hypothetical protein